MAPVASPIALVVLIGRMPIESLAGPAIDAGDLGITMYLVLGVVAAGLLWAIRR